MGVIRNLFWGMMTAAWLFGCIGVVAVLILVLSAEERSAVAEMGGFLRLFAGYGVAAAAGGIVLGLFRPIARTRFGRHVLGGAVTASAFSGFLVVVLGDVFWPDGLLMFGLAFIVGFAMAPLWYMSVASGTLWLPDFDGWLRGLGHSSDPGERQPPDGSDR